MDMASVIEIRKKVVSLLLGTVQLPGWAMLLLAIVMGVPDWNSRFEYWLQTARSTGSWIAMLAPVLAHPYFPGILGLVGVVYLVVVGWNGPSVVRHKWVPIAGWVAVAFCASALIVTGGFGLVELHIRREIAKGIAGIPRGEPGTRPDSQEPLRLADLKLQPDQIRMLMVQIPKIKALTTSVLFYTTTGNDAAADAFRQYQDVFARSGISVVQHFDVPGDPSEIGMMMEVEDIHDMPPAAEKIWESFDIAGIPVTPIKARRHGDGWCCTKYSAYQFAIFIGPPPIIGR